jgi:hypothetical protein
MFVSTYFSGVIMKIIQRLAVLLGLVLAVSCQNPIIYNLDAASAERGTLLNRTKVATRSELYLNTLYAVAGVDMKTQYRVSLHKMGYRSIDRNGNLIGVSAAVLIPEADGPLPMLIFNHGTILSSKRAPSEFYAKIGLLNQEVGTWGEALLMASQGYVTIVADYVGYGDSADLMHPHHHAESLASAVVDAILAGRKFCEESATPITDQLYMAGYSEGGYATLAAQREIESAYPDKISFNATAAGAGAYDLSGTASEILNSSSYEFPAYLGLLLPVFIQEGRPLSDVFRAPFADGVTALLDGTITDQTRHDLLDSFPNAIDEFFEPTFLADFRGSGESQLKAALQDSTIDAWVTSTPTLLFSGTQDVLVSQEINAATTYQSFQSNGSVGLRLTLDESCGGHNPCGTVFLTEALEWFADYQ